MTSTTADNPTTGTRHAPLTIYGIRHHGPGCARSLLAALEAQEPDIVLVEGPPDAAEVLPLLAHAGMQPPVALLIYAPERPRHAAFYPFATYSPEWQALRYASARGIPARFIDLPFAFQPLEEESATARPNEDAGSEDAEAGEQNDTPRPPSLADDPLGALAEAAGYADRELWWEQQVERRQDATDLFAGIMEAMAALRAESPPPNEREARREAHMRQAIRAATREGFARIAVICGAWHAPVLTSGTAREDAALLKGLKRTKVAATWVPWTNSRLGYRSGYGAGVAAPGWYAHLWEAPDRPLIRWLARAATLLREADLLASSANVVEAVRLAETLAALRDSPQPGIDEAREAILTVLCGGDQTPLALIRDRLEIGESLGAVPEETPDVPLARDLAAAQRRLRLRPSAERKALDLDLRNEIDRERSYLLHRLNLLGIPWATPERGGHSKGTFHELWTIAWRPELAIVLIEANVWGLTIADAATAKLRHDSAATTELPRLTALLDAAILAVLPDAVAALLARVRDGAAVTADVRHLLEALPPLARVARYGDVRETDGTQTLPIIGGLLARIVVGLRGACTALDDDAARAMVAAIDGAQSSIALLDRAEWRADWRGALRGLLEGDTLHGLIRGRAARLLLDEGVLDGEALGRLARLALAPATPTEAAADWIAGVVAGSGLLLLQQPALWATLDGWLRELPPEGFTVVLPLLRRAFADFSAPERRAMGDLLKRGSNATRLIPDATTALDQERASKVLPVLEQILVGGRPSAVGSGGVVPMAGNGY
jgi:hypothetical protein